MLDIAEMGAAEMHSLLKEVGYGHLGCTRKGRPYVVPIHYVYSEGSIFLYTTEGLKTDFIHSNPEVCLQVEKVHDESHWRSVIAIGRAERLEQKNEKDHALGLITQRNPKLTPAINRTWTDAWGRASVEAVYRIKPEILSGRKTVSRPL